MSRRNPSLPASPVPQESYDDFECRLTRVLGATVGGDELSKALGYPSQDAFRKAHQRGRLPVITFEVAGRRGRFAAAADIAAWLWHQRFDRPRSVPTRPGGAP